jgi:phenylalanyl-tRNA synthetase beta chain
MKIPVEWLKQYIEIDKTPRELADSFTLLGLLLDKPTEKYNSEGYQTKVLDLEHRMDRADWLAILGCARDLAAFEKTKLIYPKVYTKKGKKPSENQIVKIRVDCPEVVHRFNTVVFRNIEVKDSPDWLKNRLGAYGVPSINNIVDVTNYVMIELGQPMHAQDLAKMDAQEIIIRKAKAGEKVKTLLGETVELVPEAFVLTQNDIPTVIGGIVGGDKTGVDKTTTDIVLDAGTYDQTTVRKVSRKLKIQNETVLRYDKFLHPKLTELAIQRAAYLILEVAGGDYYENVDWYPKQAVEKEMRVDFDRIKMISGMDIPEKVVQDTLVALEYEIMDVDNAGFIVKVPYFRTDVEVEDDLVADVLRIYNYQNIPVTPINKASPTEITPKIYKFEDELRDICVKMGLHEHITEPLVKANENIRGQIKLANALSSEQSALRTTIYETLSSVGEIYKKHKLFSVGLFEIGKIYTKAPRGENRTSYEETRVLEIVYENSRQTPKETAKQIKGYLASILQELGLLAEVTMQKKGKSIEIRVDDIVLGYLKYDSITLYPKILMEQRQKADRVVTGYRTLRTEDISLVITKEQILGPVFETIKSIDPEIAGIEILERYAGREIPESHRGILLRIAHTKEEFETTKKQILDTIYKSFQISTR